jgi:SpoVK/Ycf46/Vps4 family AAA+-type ATPase
MMTVFTKNSGTKWKILILEDAGEMLTIDAKRTVGQAMSRLLNMSDGLIGQGFKFLILFTTNEEIKALSAAVTRPGRCYQQIQFELLDKDEAEAWLKKRKYKGDPLAEKYYSIAELYSILEGIPEEKDALLNKKVVLGFGG